MRILVSSVLIAFAMGACASQNSVESLDAATLQKLSSIKVLETTLSRSNKIIGQVSGVSCERAGYFPSKISDSDAVNKLKINAARLGADAVINTTCQMRNEVDWKHNCTASFVCAGVAVKFN